MHDHVFNGRTNYNLNEYNCAHRNAYVLMEQCSDQVTYQLPTPHTRVSHYLKVITSPDTDIRAGIASICQDKKGMRPTLHPYVQMTRTKKKLRNILTEKFMTLQVKLISDQLRLRRAWVRPA